MPEEQLKDFLEQVKGDTNLQQKLINAADVETVLSIAKEAGFSISEIDLKTGQSEVSEQELEFIAGGGNTWYYMTIGQGCGYHSGCSACENPNSGYWWC